MTTHSAPPPSGLGRGLASLIPQRPAAIAAPTEIPIVRISRNPYQPRRAVDQEAIEQLAASIREHGVLQPVLVTETFDGYQLVAGERRVRAAQLAGLERVPAVIRQLADRDQLELALVENLQRADLSAIEEAHAFRQLIDEFGLTQDAIATGLGRSRSGVANTLRLLETHDSVQEAIASGLITEGHGRALAGLPRQIQPALLQTVIARDLSVRQAEELVRRVRDPAEPRNGAKPTSVRDPDLERVEEDLRRSLGTKVSLARTRKGGRIVIEYYNDEDLGRLYERLVGGTA
ncbi:MAG: ParB/RepB/Spo0J family partition protein [Chloroflexi bacterium]|nr:MAG: ParB/RepB/Spo0J family partition protein [Chloroflexota bacterium]